MIRLSGAAKIISQIGCVSTGTGELANLCRPIQDAYPQRSPAPEKQKAGHLDDGPYCHYDSFICLLAKTRCGLSVFSSRTVSGSGVMVNRRKLHRQAIQVREVN